MIKDDHQFSFEDNIPDEGDVAFSTEMLKIFMDLFSEELLEKCSDLSKGQHGAPS